MIFNKEFNEKFMSAKSMHEQNQVMREWINFRYYSVPEEDLIPPIPWEEQVEVAKTQHEENKARHKYLESHGGVGYYPWDWTPEVETPTKKTKKKPTQQEQ